MRRATPVLALLAAIALSSCGADAPAEPSSGIRGRALAGPQCPVEIEGSPCPDRPWQGIVVATDVETGDRATAETDAAGRFELPLDPGTYELTIEPEGELPFAKPQTVTVEAGAFVEVTVAVDTGIR
ncbi:MAG TPA: carboxypeptidase-like regulatory domain-containing protein [Actinomycetota bacterium]|nr:carboxypeptidase-like regulatory domain-containing protein [Actinomycetota bacterium]